MVYYGRELYYHFCNGVKIKTPRTKSHRVNKANCHLTDKLLNYDFILGRDIIQDLFFFKNKTITWQAVSISMKPPNCAAKEFFLIKESCPVQNITKRIKLISYAEFKKINLKAYEPKSFKGQT